MAEKDIAPELIEKVNKDFEENLSKDKKAAALKEKLSQGSADYADAYEYAESVGTARAKAFGAQISSEVLPDGRMYYNIASRLMEETLTADHNMVSEFASGVQKTYNEKAGIGLKALKADVDEDRIDGFVQRLASEEDYDEVSWLLDEPVVTHARSVVDDTIKKNAEFQHKSGIKATVTRKAAPRCCDWCTDLEGDYTYPNVDGKVFQRHDHCKCTVDYEGRRLTAYEGKNGSHSLRDQEERERIEERIIKHERVIGEEQKRKIHYGKTEQFKRDYAIVSARSVRNMAENNLYVENSVTLSPREMRWINNNVSEAKRILKLNDDCKIPIVVVNDDSILAAYNPRTNIMFVSSRMSNQRAVLKLQQGFASENDPNSTMVHELLHWKDADEYRKNVGEIKSAEPFSEYSLYQREKAFRMLEKSGIDLNDLQQIRDISEYAYQKAVANEFEEVYTEYRVKELLGD